MITIPLEDNFEATLTQQLTGSASSLTIYLSKVPVCTIPSGKELVMVLNPGKGFTGSVQQENVLIESIDSVNKTVTVKTGGRAQVRYNGDTPSPVTHAVGTKIIISDPYIVWNQLDDYLSLSGGVMTGPITGPVYANAAARDAAITAPANGQSAYLTAEGYWTDYVGGSWVQRATGATPNASETVAGKTEQATLSEQIAKTETGATGAPLFLNPKNTATTSSDAAEGAVVKLNSSLKIDSTLMSPAASTTGTANTTITSGQALSFNGNTRLDLADANDAGMNAEWLFAGIATAAATSGNSAAFAAPGPIVTVPAFTLSQRASCRLWAGEANATSNTTSDTITAITAWRYQTFIPQTGQDNVGRVTVNVTNSSLVGTMQCKIYATTGTAPNLTPTGSALGTAIALSSFASGDLTFEFTTPVSVTPGTAYAIVVHLSAYTSGNFAWNYQNTDVYANGNSGNSSNSGSAWTAEPTYDRRFAVYYRGIAGEPVYMSDTAGALELAPGTYAHKIGNAVDTTHIILAPGLKSIYATYNYTASAAGTVDTQLTLGFRPMLVFASLQIGSTTKNKGSMGVWMNGGASFSVENKENFAVATGATQLFGAMTTGLLYYSGLYNSTAPLPANYTTQTLTVQASDANSITVRRVVAITGTPSDATNIYLNIIGF